MKQVNENPRESKFPCTGKEFKVDGIQSETTTRAGTIWPSSGAGTGADISAFDLGRPVGPAKVEG